MTKTYKHTVLWREAEIIDKEEDVYCFVDDDANEHNFYWKELISLWFIEAPTDTEEKGDWIDKAYSLYDADKRVNWPDDFNAFSDSIEISINNLPYAIFDSMRIDETVDIKYTGITADKIKWYIEDFMPKPVEQELVPLDVETIIQEITDSCWLRHYTKRLRNILSRYWVHKQEEKSSNTVAFIVDSYGNTPNPQATSVDVEEDKIETIVQDLRECMVTKPIGVRWWWIVSMVEIREIVKKHLSSLPIQKKRTREEIWNACNRDIKNDFANTNCDEYRSYVVVSKVMKSFWLLKD